MRTVQPFHARKTYACPGCGNPIPPATSHIVVWAEYVPDDRDHWHHHCWRDQATRRSR